MSDSQKPSQPEVGINDLLSLHGDVEKAARKLLVHAMEFHSDWEKGDFDLPKLAELDMQSMAHQFHPLFYALQAVARHRLNKDNTD